jgi:ABC-type uncharacterized transport system fused permease/ATPase subunit
MPCKHSTRWRFSAKSAFFGILVAFAVLASVSALYLKQLLQIRWRRWLTKRYLATWLADRAYYKLQLGSAADNPDQRIAEDHMKQQIRLSAFTMSYAQIAVIFPVIVVSPRYFARKSFWAV